jgi:anaerobic selenocysteine-containing dehydrogenase
VFNPLKERGLERFLSPQHPVEMLTGRATKIASVYHQVRVGGDAAVMKGLMKALLALDGKNGRQVIDRDFIKADTSGYEALVQDIKATKWKEIERCSGLTRSEIESTAEIYANAKNVIFCYGMGLTQHRHGTQVVQQLANLMLMRGQVGRPGAGICPLRGHSNVQGDRTVASPRFPTPSCSSGWKRPSASSRRMNTAIVPSTPSRP